MVPQLGNGYSVQMNSLFELWEDQSNPKKLPNLQQTGDLHCLVHSSALLPGFGVMPMLIVAVPPLPPRRDGLPESPPYVIEHPPKSLG